MSPPPSPTLPGLSLIHPPAHLRLPWLTELVCCQNREAAGCCRARGERSLPLLPQQSHGPAHRKDAAPHSGYAAPAAPLGPLSKPCTPGRPLLCVCCCP